MNHRPKARRGVTMLTTVSLAGLLASCGTPEPAPDFNAPPTVRESRILGVDATDSYFLTRYRKCIRWKSEQICREEPYGDDEGGFH